MYIFWDSHTVLKKILQVRYEYARTSPFIEETDGQCELQIQNLMEIATVWKELKEEKNYYSVNKHCQVVTHHV